MQFDRKKVIETILSSAEKVAQELPDGQRCDFTESSTLFGANSPFDSLMLVSFVVELEQALERNFGETVTLADERAMSQSENPFTTVRSLANYVEVLLKEK
jgi:acyl carrier protein